MDCAVDRMLIGPTNLLQSVTFSAQEKEHAKAKPNWGEREFSKVQEYDGCHECFGAGMKA
jgi:hypothetical protein